MKFNETKWQYVRDFINDNCIERTPPGCPHYLLNVNLKQYYTWQFYTRAAMLNPIVLELVTDHFFYMFEPILQDVQLAGVESASTPFLTAFVMRAYQKGIDLNAFSIRKDRKPYGKKNWIEGRVLNKPVMLIDDLTSESHKTIFHASRILNLHRIDTINQNYCLIQKQKRSEVKPVQLETGEVHINSMFMLDDFDLTFKEYWAKKNLMLTEKETK